TRLPPRTRPRRTPTPPRHRRRPRHRRPSHRRPAPPAHHPRLAQVLPRGLPLDATRPHHPTPRRPPHRQDHHHRHRRRRRRHARRPPQSQNRPQPPHLPP